MKKIRIFLADDHALFREGLAGILSTQVDFEVVGQASDGLEAVVKVKELVPDIVLLDIEMPGLDGLEAAHQINQALPETTLIMLTVRDDPEKMFQAIKNGAQGYLLKSIRSKEMIELLRGAAAGEAAISPTMASQMLEEFRRLSSLAQEVSEGDLSALTHREQEVLSLAAVGKSDKQMAQDLSLSLHTVKSHMRSILYKLHASNRREAARIARKKGLI